MPVILTILLTILVRGHSWVVTLGGVPWREERKRAAWRRRKKKPRKIIAEVQKSLRETLDQQQRSDRSALPCAIANFDVEANEAWRVAIDRTSALLHGKNIFARSGDRFASRQCEKPGTAISFNESKVIEIDRGPRDVIDPSWIAGDSRLRHYFGNDKVLICRWRTFSLGM